MNSIVTIIIIGILVIITSCDMLGLHMLKLDNSTGTSIGTSIGNLTSASPPITISRANVDTMQTNTKDITYELQGDIDLSNTTWTPLGDSQNQFLGTFDGNGKVISGLTIRNTPNSTHHFGFFAWVGQGAVVKNITLSGPQLTTTVKYSRTGPIAGVNWGTIENVKVIGGTIEGGIKIGGITGNNGGVVKNCYSTAAIKGRTPQGTGGIVGTNYGNIINSYATGNIDMGGGVVGSNHNNVINCYFDKTNTGRPDGIYTKNSGLQKVEQATGYTEVNSYIINSAGNTIEEKDFNTWDFNNIWRWIGNGQWPALR